MGLFSNRPDHVPAAANNPREPRPKGSQKGVVRRDHNARVISPVKRTRSFILTNEDKRPRTRWWE